MKLMIDENFSYRIKKYLQNDFIDIIHVSVLLYLMKSIRIWYC